MTSDIMTIKQLRALQHRRYCQVVGAICRYWRVRKGIKLSYVAECIDSSAASITRFEKGQSNNVTALLYYINSIMYDVIPTEGCNLFPDFLKVRLHCQIRDADALVKKYTVEIDKNKGV